MTALPRHRDDGPVPIHERASENLDFIRRTMERSAGFTSVSGLGGMAMGLIALAAAGWASGRAEIVEWAFVWIGAAAASIVVNLAAIAKKAARVGESLVGGGARHFAISLAPPLVVGMVLTPTLVRVGDAGLLAGCWLLCWGAGVMIGGLRSLTVIRAIGGTVMLLGALALYLPEGWANGAMATGFGGVNLAGGAWIYWRHGG